ncbi:hypothetical protein D3C76_1595150 [compost metagenome]
MRTGASGSAAARACRLDSKGTAPAAVSMALSLRKSRRDVEEQQSSMHMGRLRRQRGRGGFVCAAGPPKGFEYVDAQRAQLLDPLCPGLRQVDGPLAKDVRRVVAQ